MRNHDQPPPCGLVCRTCNALKNDCGGCLAGGRKGLAGEERCHIRLCTAQKGLAGCWECDAFPCGYFDRTGPAWSGLCIGFIEAIREMGPERFSQLALQALGEYRGFNDLQNMSAEEAKRLILQSQ